MKNQDLLTIEDVCKMLNIKESHLRSLIFKNEIPFLKVGRLVRFDIEDILVWVNKKNIDIDEKIER